MIPVAFWDGLLLWPQITGSVMWIRDRWAFFPRGTVITLLVYCHPHCHFVYFVSGMGWWGAISLILSSFCDVLKSSLTLYQDVILEFGCLILVWLVLSSFMSYVYCFDHSLLVSMSYMHILPLTRCTISARDRMPCINCTGLCFHSCIFNGAHPLYLNLVHRFFWLLPYKGDLTYTPLMTLRFSYSPVKVKVCVSWIYSLILLSPWLGSKFAQKYRLYTACSCWYLRAVQLIRDEGKGVYPLAYEDNLTEAFWLILCTEHQLLFIAISVITFSLPIYHTGWYECFNWYVVLQLLWTALLSFWTQSPLPLAATKKGVRLHFSFFNYSLCNLFNELEVSEWFSKPMHKCMCHPFSFVSWRVSVNGHFDYSKLDMLDSMYWHNWYVMTLYIASGTCFMALAWHPWMLGHAQVGPGMIRDTISRVIFNRSPISKTGFRWDMSVRKGPYMLTLIMTLFFMSNSDNYGYQHANLVLALGPCCNLEKFIPFSKR